MHIHEYMYMYMQCMYMQCMHIYMYTLGVKLCVHEVVDIHVHLQVYSVSHPNKRALLLAFTILKK